MSLLEVEHLRVRFDLPGGRVQAVEDISFRLEPGQTVGLVGESGSGKSVTALALLGLLPPSAVIETGESRFGNVDLLTLSERDLRPIRGNRIAMVFQDALSALNPLLTIGRQLEEVLETHLSMNRREARRRAAAALGEVGIPDPEARLDLFPHELSGGQRQRAMIAMALMCEPKVLLADEPTTALDVTMQAQVLDLLEDLQERHGTSILLITHDLGVVARAAQRVLVMYQGRLVEEASTDELFRAPLHPYTLALLTGVPRLDTRTDVVLAPILHNRREALQASHGCAFLPRCPFRKHRCSVEAPTLEPWRPGGEGAAKAANLRFIGGRRAACFEMETVGQARPEGAREGMRGES